MEVTALTVKTERRLDALEACAARIETAPPLFIIRIVWPGYLNSALTRARIGDPHRTMPLA